MKVLHLFSNWKFTGPADPAMVLATALRETGVEISFAAGRTPAEDRGVMELARERGLPLLEGLQLRKHGQPLPWIHDVRALRRRLRRREFDLVHCHLPNDHAIAATAARGTGVPVVRSLYELEPPARRRERAAARRSSALLPPTDGAARRLRALLPDRGIEIVTVPPALDRARFPSTTDRSVREAWEIGAEEFVLGVVARMQRHRRFPELIEGFRQVAVEDAGIHLVILGRGTHQVAVAHEPAARSGVEERIHFPGYIDPTEYPRALGSFDALLFLVPGSDGTCRAMREAQARGIPVIVSRRGLLPELILPGESGLLLEEDSPEAIAAAIRELRRDPALRDRLAEGAARHASRTFDPAEAAARVREIYGRCLDRGAAP